MSAALFSQSMMKNYMIGKLYDRYYWSACSGVCNVRRTELMVRNTAEKLNTWLVPKVPLHIHFYSERIAGTNQSYSCRIIGHVGTYFTVQHYTQFNDITVTVTLVTMSRHDRSRSNYAKCFRNIYFSQSAKSTLV